MNVKQHAEAMREISDILAGFRPEEQLVMVAGQLGNVLCKLGDAPSRHTAAGMLGTALQMTFDMIDRHFQPEKFDA